MLRPFEIELPRLADEVVAEAVMRFFLGQLEPGALINVTRGVKHVVGPEHQLRVAGLTGKVDTLLDELCPEAEPACLRLDQQAPEPGNCLALLHQEHTTRELTG